LILKSPDLSGLLLWSMLWAINHKDGTSMRRQFLWATLPFLCWLVWWLVAPDQARAFVLPNVAIVLLLLYVGLHALFGLDNALVRLFYFREGRRIRAQRERLLTPDDFFRAAERLSWPWLSLGEGLEEKGVTLFFHGAPIANSPQEIRDIRVEYMLDIVRAKWSPRVQRILLCKLDELYGVPTRYVDSVTGQTVAST
jgi:hypothetical protein